LANHRFMANTNPAPAGAQASRTFQIDALEVRVYPRQADLARAAAAVAQNCLQEVLARQGAATAILASANSQIQFLEALVALGGVDWSRLTLFHMDEYLGIDADHPASFRRYMRERVERLVKPRQFHYLQGDAMEPLAECERYARRLQAQPIDLCCLGIGENGHVAFNDPPVANFHDPHQVKLVKLDLECRQQQVGEGHFPNLEAVPQYAFSLTVPMLCSAKKLLAIVPEQRKARAVKAALQGAISTACPASFLRQQAHCTLFLDADSASLL
jgi:glucosamine-6-phosphate deaminase